MMGWRRGRKWIEWGKRRDGGREKKGWDGGEDGKG